MHPLEILTQVKNAIRHPYAWPGGYPVYTVLSDGSMLCRECARDNFRQICSDTYGYNTGWRAYGADVLWETEGGEYCGHCGEELESAYGDVSADA